jgi:CheY-like chemotaxis protein
MEDMIRGVLNEQIELVLDLESSLGIIEADPHQIEQIILNLASNARDAMPDKGRLVIKSWNEAGTPAWVGISVSDTGHGMDEATRRRIFEPFFTTKALGKGTGLGLASVYGTVQQSHGQITVESEPGQGTTFRIRMPRATETAPPEPSSVATERGEGVETVLLVEDDSGVREILATGLEHEGYRVFLAANGHEALDFYAKHKPEISLVVSDLVMPVMGGIELGEKLFKQGADVPVIYMSGYHHDMDKRRLESLPLCVAFLLKPFSPLTLASTIQKTLAGRGPARGPEKTTVQSNWPASD